MYVGKWSSLWILHLYCTIRFTKCHEYGGCGHQVMSHPVLDSTPPWQTRLVNDWFLSANCVTNLDTWSPCLMLESNSLYFASSILIFWKYFHEWQEYKRWVQNTESFYFEVEKFCYCHLLVLWICKVCSWARSKMCLENPSISFRSRQGPATETGRPNKQNTEDQKKEDHRSQKTYERIIY